MKSFLRENPTIAFGLGLPLLLVVVFLLFSGIPALVVAPPQYGVLYATGYYNYQNGVQISVVDQKIQLAYQGMEQANQKPRLWLYNPKTGAVKEIAIIVPSGLPQAGQTQQAPGEVPNRILLNAPDLEGLRVDSSSIAPDGYEFRLGSNRYAGNIFGDLFYASRYRHDAVLTKNGRNVRLPDVADLYYSGNTHFIGWVVSP